ncbi:hypothetical protein EWM64_g8433 [Hericium alpestre]|uniref:Uncharacterized protein n=1 Tax=Hericium alpestre TaxID=135208 RepID=A0A4Y9ZQ63_9AGAM|nr:hypothetical protein EWM64_g8433 [Hericium alpestre]
MSHKCIACPDPKEFDSFSKLQIHYGTCSHYLDEIRKNLVSNHRRRLEKKCRRLQGPDVSVEVAEPDVAAAGSIADADLPMEAPIEQPPSPSPPPPPPLPPSPPCLTRAGRPARRYRLPKQFIQPLPEPPAPILATPTTAPCADEPDERDLAEDSHQRDPENTTSLDDLTDLPSSAASILLPSCPPIGETTGPPTNPYEPFANPTIGRLMAWQWSGSEKKSKKEMNDLVHNVLLAHDTDVRRDLQGFSADRETARMDAYLEGRTQVQSTEATAARDGWQCSPVSIPVPDGQKHASESDALRFTIPGLYHRSLVEVMKSTVADSTAE